jgi:hypothetical protein
MNANLKWHNVLRLVWVAGGVVAVNEPGPSVQIVAGMGGRNLQELRISTYESLFEVLRTHGFLILGATFVEDPKVLQGLRPPDFRAMSLNNKGWLVWDARQRWREVAFAAGKSGHMPLMDLAARIASVHRYSQMRLYDLATAYSLQLRCRLHDREAKEYQAFQDLNSFEVYKAIHALFWEMAVLRDVLAEFIATFCFSQIGVTSLKGLRKALNKNRPIDPLADEILQAADHSSGGWIATFTSYRNFFTHVAPMEQAANVARTVQDMRTLAGGLSIPQIYYALPEDIEDLTRRRKQGILFSSLEELGAASFRRHDRSMEPDALEYLHRCMDQFVELSLKLVSRSPVAPKPST